MSSTLIWKERVTFAICSTYSTLIYIYFWIKRIGDNVLHQIITGGSSEPSAAQLTGSEQAFVSVGIETLREIVAYQRDLGAIFDNYAEDISKLVGFAKFGFNAPFGGLLPKGGEFGMRIIRALTTFAPTTQSLYWPQNISAGWNTLFSVNLNYGGTSGKAATQLQNNYTMDAFGLLIPETSLHLLEHQLKVGDLTYMVQTDAYKKISNLYYLPFEGIMHIGKNLTGSVSVLSDVAYTTAAELFGVEFFTQTVGSQQD